jgi:hypothetical protein
VEHNLKCNTLRFKDQGLWEILTIRIMKT